MMNLSRLIRRNLWFYRKPYLSVMFGVMTTTAVLTGALIVGDSVRFSLQKIAHDRLGGIRYAVPPGERFFRQELARGISGITKQAVAPAVQCGAMAINSSRNLRINQVVVTGIDQRFCDFWDHPFRNPGEEEAIISRNVAEKLGLKKGDDLLLRIQKQGGAPPDAPFAMDKKASVSLRVRVTAIAGDEGMGRFSLKSNQAAPYNIFVSLAQMSLALGLPGFANMILTGGDDTPATGPANPDGALRHCWQPEDAGIHFTRLPSLPDEAIPHERAGGTRMEVTTSRIFFDDNTAEALQSVVPGCEPVLTWMVNSISCGNHATPYSFVTGVSDSFLGRKIQPREIIVNNWLAKDLALHPGDSVGLRYFLMGPMRSLREDSTRFVVGAIVPDRNSLADRGLMPAFPGMSDAGNCRDWETGAPIDLKKIRDKDEQYWKEYRGTPKAFIRLETGQRIWNNRFGRFTAFRFVAVESQIKQIRNKVMSELSPVQSGLTFRDVFREGRRAAGNGSDFGQLFLSLSFFIILSALLLTVLLFSLSAMSRLGEAGILSAAGFRRRTIILVMIAEALVVAIAGAVPGAGFGILFNRLLILGLNTLWIDAVGTSMVVMHVEPVSLVIGALVGIVLSVSAMAVVLRSGLRNPLSELVKGKTSGTGPAVSKRFQHLSAAAGIVFPAISVIMVTVLLVTRQTMNVPLYLLAGAMALAGGLFLANFVLSRTVMTKAHLIPRFRGLVIRNMAQNRRQTMAVLTLLALGTFSVIITGANRKTYHGAGPDRSSGTGGFLFWAETLLPIRYDLNSSPGIKAYSLGDEALLKPLHYVHLTRRDGDDASCLNLNQVSQPALLGVPQHYFDRVGAFSFTSLHPTANHEHPWKSLEKELAPGVIPGFADQTVITWGLGRKNGDTLFYRAESGKTLKIRLVGGLENSIFQGNILVSDSLLRLFYPSAGGSQVLLIEAPSASGDTIARRLEMLFRDEGMMVTRAGARLEAFDAVENTYLSVFMMLGGLGMIIGTIGFGILILRNIRRRKQEFALYRALGVTKNYIFRLIVAEHVLMLIAAMLLGMVSALAGILPSLATPGAAVPWLFMAGLILLMTVNGMLWIFIPARAALKNALLPGLRGE